VVDGVAKLYGEANKLLGAPASRFGRLAFEIVDGFIGCLEHEAVADLFSQAGAGDELQSRFPGDDGLPEFLVFVLLRAGERKQDCEDAKAAHQRSAVHVASRTVRGEPVEET
jgi:hypothetical protein